MKDVIILSPALKKEFAKIKKHALKQIASEGLQAIKYFTV